MSKPPRFNAGASADKPAEKPMTTAGLRDFRSITQPPVDPDPERNPDVARLIDESPVHSVVAPAGTTPTSGHVPAKKKDRPRYYLEEDEARLEAMVSDHMRMTGTFTSPSRLLRAAIRHLEATTTAEQRLQLVASVPDRRRRA